MENLETKFVELIEKFEALATEIAPEVLELGLMAARVAAAESVMRLLLLVGVAWLLIRHSTRLIREGTFSIDDGPDKKLIFGSFLSAAAAAFGISAFIRISVWPFVGIFYPELWIAKQVLGW